MNKWQEDVRDFHKACDIPAPKSYTLLHPDRAKLRKNLIKEESKELREALIDGNTVEVIDGMVDLIVVVLGTAIEMGVDLDPFWDEVQRTNMAKSEGPKREDGKQLKPEGWRPPDIAGVLAKQRGDEV